MVVFLSGYVINICSLVAVATPPLAIERSLEPLPQPVSAGCLLAFHRCGFHVTAILGVDWRLSLVVKLFWRPLHRIPRGLGQGPE